MTRWEAIREHLLAHGPMTTKEIAAAMGWRENSASAAVSHARSYGFVSQIGKKPRIGRRGSQFIWGAGPIINRPGS